MSKKRHPGFRARLALSTALATIAFGYGSRGAYAGACAGGPNTYTCTGVAGADVTQTLSGAPLTVTTASAFGITTAGGNGLSLTGTGGLTFTDTYSSAITGAARGINAVNNTSGALSLTTTGQVTGNTNVGMVVRGYAGTTGITVSTNGVTGSSRGIDARHYGAGAVSITTTGQVTGTGSVGMYARNVSGGDLTVSAVNVSGFSYGLDAFKNASGTLSVTVSGVVTGGTGAGLRARTGGGGTSVITLNSGADVSSSSAPAIVGNGSNSTLLVNAGANVTGDIQLGGGTDDITFNGGTFSAVTSFDGGTGADSLTFTSVTGTVAGATVLNMENLTVGSSGNISLSGTLNTDTVTVNSGGTLGGIATINADVTVNGGTLSAGNSPGQLDIVGNLDLGAASTTLVELEGLTAGSQYDQIDVSGGTATLTAGATFDIDFFGIFTAGLGDIFDILVADDIVGIINTLNFDFSGATLGAGLIWDTSIVTVDTREALRLTVLESEADALPEPSALALLGTILFGLFGYSRARRRKTA